MKKLDLVRLFATSLRIRLIETAIANEYPQGEMRCPVHLSVGQELLSAVFEQVQTREDTAISSHRAHAHYLGKGGNLNRMIAELYGKVTGCSKGRGGSMHLIDLEKGFIGSSAIVGNSIPIGVGVAMSHKLKENGKVSYIFFGDGAIEEGAFYEAINFAAVHELPCVFVCENNRYSVYTGLERRQPTGRSIAALAEAIGVKSEVAGVGDYLGTFRILESSTQRARMGLGPTFIEVPTYRFLEHCGPNDDNHLGYRPIGELDFQKNLDFIIDLESRLLTEKIMNQDEVKIIKSEIENEIAQAFNFAKKSRFPAFEEIMTGTYAI
jgi:TPP-dependent pyruvate/acetoin dehydrogenase alpha subunit